MESVVDSEAKTVEAPAASVMSAASGGKTPTTDLLNYTFPNSTNIIIERYQKYIKLIKTIEAYASGYCAVACASIKEYETLNNTITTEMPNFESKDGSDTAVSGSVRVQSPQLGTAGAVDATIASDSHPISNEEKTDMNTVMYLMRQRLGQDYTNVVEMENKIRSHVLPDLRELLKSVEKKRSDCANISSSAERDLKQLRDASAKVSTKLDASVQDFERGVHAKNSSDYRKDPYLVKKSLLRDAVLQIKAENSRVEFLANAESSLRSFENRVLLELKRIFDSLTNIIDHTYGGILDNVRTLSTAIDNVSDDLQWGNFLIKNSKFLITANPTDNMLAETMSNLSVTTNENPTADVILHNPYKRSLESVTFRNNTHPSTKPVLEGILARKESKLGITSKYNSYYFVVTPAGYFYGFPSRSIDSYQPNLILYIPDCETRNMCSAKSGEFKFSLRGKDLCGLSLKPKKNFVFKASSANEFEIWWKVISSNSESVGNLSRGGSDISDVEE